MSFYEPQGWQAPARQASWEQPAPPSRSGASSTSLRDDGAAFTSQLEEVDRAVDNLVKSGKLYNGPLRRDSMPMMMGRPFSEYDPRMMGASPSPQRHHSVSDFDPSRPHSGSNLQNFYASQRYGNRPNEAEQMMQARRRVAAQRERELRNYHQEQQYNRSVVSEMSSNKSDRSMSPANMTEESRRELIARQHRALYGNDSAAFFPAGGIGADGSRPETQGSGASSAVPGARGPSPRGTMNLADGGNQPIPPGPTDNTQQRSRADSSSSPNSATQPAGANPTSNPAQFSLFDNAAPRPRDASASSPGESPSRPTQKAATAPIGSSVAPIGTRPTQPVGSQPPNPALSKRSTTPLPSPLSFGFAPNESSANVNERSTSAGSNPNSQAKESSSVGLGWGSNSGVWGNKSLGVQASVWG